MESGSSKVVRFGVFELDLAARQLRKNGTRVKLQEQPFRVLQLLTECPGEVVTREELKEKLWSDDTFVEFDHSLNTAIQKIRTALADSATNPRFVETVPRVGYRFLAPVDDRSSERANEPARPKPKPRKTVALLSALGLMLALAAASMFDLLPSLTPEQALQEPRPIASFMGVEYGAALSPDGTQVAFVWDGDAENNHDIYVRQIEGGGQVRLTTDASRDSDPAWSPDGEWIAFCRKTPSGVDLYRVPSIGGPERRIASFPEQHSGLFANHLQKRLDWSRDGSYLAFLYGGPERKGLGAGIYSVSLADGSSRLLHPALAGDMVSAALSPDGSRIAYHPGFGTYAASPIYVLDLHESSPRELVRRTRVQGLDWSPDGRFLIFSEAGRLYRVQATGGEPVAIVGLSSSIRYPSVASRGAGLVFDQTVTDMNIWRIRLDEPGGAAEKFLASSRYDGDAVFSPDGEKVAFVSGRTGSSELWVAEADGSEPVQLTRFASAAVGSPFWSPDGEWIVFDSDKDGDQNVYIISVSGGEARRLTLTPAWEAFPSWSRDGVWIYFASDRSGKWRVWKKRADGSGEEIRVTDQDGRQSYESFDGKYLFFSEPWHRDGIWRYPLAGETELVLPDTGRQRWQLTDKGIYYLVGVNSPEQTVKFYDFDSQTATDIYRFPPDIRLGNSGRIRISPDGKTLLHTRVDYASADVMYVPGFR